MKVNDAKLIISAVSKKQYPRDHLPEIALAGRSNVGKSSFINRLIQRRSLARTSSKPGKTQTLNFYQINHTFYLVDVPGYGYAKVSKQERAKWGEMMEEYFEHRKELRCIVLITDLRHKPTKADQQMYAYTNYLHLPTVVVATKADKVSKANQQKFLTRTRNALQIQATDPLIAFSAETGLGKDAVWAELQKYL